MIHFMRLRVALIAAVSSLLFSVIAVAHEMDPTVVDIQINDGSVALQVTLNLEAFVAGIDLENVENTDAAENSADYDVLRELEPDGMRAAFAAYWPQMQKGINLLADGQPLALELQSLEVPPVGNANLPRQSVVRLIADNPENAPVSISWKPSFGSMILRQTEPAENAFTGYLTPGQQSPALSRDGMGEENGWQIFLRMFQ